MQRLLSNILFSATTESAKKTADEIIAQILAPINILIYVILGIVAAFGVFILIKGIIEFIPAWQERDSSSLFQAGKGIIVGILLMAISTIVGIFYPGL